MSDEEKKAIDHIKNYPINWLIENVNESAIKIVLNLIEKQSKEIEELKEQNLIQRKQLNDAFDRGWIHKDKIKAKIGELDKMKSNGKYTILFNSDNVMEVVKAVLESLLEKE